MYKLLDLFCGAGGASKGYHDAGFEITGVDKKPQPHYPYEFILANALTFDFSGFDIIHASPPCQEFTRANSLRKGKYSPVDYDKLHALPEIQKRLIKSGKPYIIENVPGAYLEGRVVQLCGSSFGLKVWRHRYFASNLYLRRSLCNHTERPVGVYYTMNYQIYKGGKTASTLEEAQEAMGIDWMEWNELKEAIPPAYTEYLGKQILEGNLLDQFAESLAIN